MAIRVGKRKDANAVRFQMTSLIDIAFLMVIFFMLISRFISAENIRLMLPKPDNNLAKAMEFPDRVVLNCLYVSESDSQKPTAKFQLGPYAIQNLSELEARLTSAKQENPKIQIIVRADKQMEYKLIREAMQVIAKAGIENMNIAAELRD